MPASERRPAIAADLPTGLRSDLCLPRRDRILFATALNRFTYCQRVPRNQGTWRSISFRQPAAHGHPGRLFRSRAADKLAVVAVRRPGESDATTALGKRPPGVCTRQVALPGLASF